MNYKNERLLGRNKKRFRYIFELALPDGSGLFTEYRGREALEPVPGKHSPEYKSFQVEDDAQRWLETGEWDTRTSPRN